MMDMPNYELAAGERRPHAEGIRRSIRHMRTRIADKLSLEEMAGIACMSPFHYLRVFQQLTGVPPARFFGALRLEAAKGLLTHSTQPVLDVCHEVGYSSLGTFTTRFTQLVGLAPARYREMYHELRSAVSRDSTMPPRPQRTPPPGPHWHGEITRIPAAAAVFVGVFASRIPQELPLACDIVTDSHEFHLEVPDDAEPDARYFVLSVALLPVPDFDRLFDNRSLIGAVGVIGPVSPRSTAEPLRLELRDYDLLDPPVLVAFPLLMHIKLRALPPFRPAPLADYASRAFTADLASP
jgi:AraC family transcriptional regulator